MIAMGERFDLIVRGGRVWLADGLADADIGVSGGRIAKVGALGGASAAETIDAGGLTVLPGAIDTQVHFREPGNEHKEDLASGTACAALGGVTAVFEMPNTRPSTTTAALLADKLKRAAGRVHCDIAFYVGATADNADDLGRLERLPGCCGVKVFMGSSTGDLLVSDEATLVRVMKSSRRRMAVHAEDDERLSARKAAIPAGADARWHPEWRDVETAVLATQRLLKLARQYAHPVHVLHVTTAEEAALLARSKDIATMEVTPQHLTLAAPDCYERLGTLAQMNPPIRDARHREALWKAVSDGVVDVIGSDHAPHTLAEKKQPYPASPSGMPGVQTLLPLMLDHMHRGRLDLRRLVELTSGTAARLFSIKGKGRIGPGFDADLVLVDLKRRQRIEPAWLASKCGWSPFAGDTVTGWPVMTVLRGQVAAREGELSKEAKGRPLQFDRERA
jgi:dihydroorotase